MKRLTGIPNIVQCKEYYEKAGDVFLVQELCEPGDLIDGYYQPNRFYTLPQTDVLKMIFQLASGLSAAHRIGIIHRDLKSTNILVTSDGELKICDLGHAKDITPSAEIEGR